MESSETVSFTAMKDGTREDYELLRKLERPFHVLTASRVFEELDRQSEHTIEGYKLTRLDHALQCATRAERDGANIEWVVAALLHDIGDGLAPQNHDRMSAEVVRPFVREEVSWVVEHHGIFQMLYYGHHYGWDRNARDQFKDHLGYQTCSDFCERWDQSSFDPNYDSEPLPYFENMVRAVFDRNAYDPAVIQSGVYTGLLP